MLIVKNNIVCSKELIKDFEEKNNIQIPDQLKRFLLKYNGGETPRTSIKSKDTATDVRVIYGLGDVKHKLNGEGIKEEEGIKYLAFACDSFGNEFEIELSAPYNIFYREHGSDNKVVTSSLIEFFDHCTSEKINEASKLSPEEREKRLIEKGKKANITYALREMWVAEYNKYRDMEQIEIDI